MRYHLASEACRRQTCNEDHEHIFINKQFENLNEALDYIKAQELDSQFHRRSCYSKNVYYAVSRYNENCNWLLGVSNYTLPQFSCTYVLFIVIILV